MEEGRFLSMKDLAKRTNFTEWQIRHWVKKRRDNGLSPFVVMVRGSIYVNVDAFDVWQQVQDKKPSNRKSKKKIKHIQYELPVGNKMSPTEKQQNQRASNDDGICRVATISHRDGFFKRIFNRIFNES
jgi:hypothetical protein